MLSQNEIKYINALKIKKNRFKYGEFIAEGPKLIKDLIQSGLTATQIYTDNTLFKEFTFPLSITKSVSTADLQKITSLKTAYQAIAIFKFTNEEAKPILDNEWVLALDEIQDPGNMGTIIRTADWFGIQKIILSKGCVDPFSPKVVQASMGSIGRVKMEEMDLVACFKQHNKMPVYGGVLDGNPLEKENFNKKGFILIGNEGNGISASILPFVNKPITITRIGAAESLNAAISAAIICAKACLSDLS